jgi:hypothetical protein
MSAGFWFVVVILTLVGGIVTTIVVGIQKGKNLPPVDKSKLRPWTDEKD